MGSTSSDDVVSENEDRYDDKPLHPQHRLEGGVFLMLMVIMEPNLMKVGGYDIITHGHFEVGSTSIDDVVSENEDSYVDKPLYNSFSFVLGWVGLGFGSHEG